jgi:hypothetical protein
MSEKGWIIVALIAASAGCVMTGHEDAAAWFGAAVVWVIVLL